MDSIILYSTHCPKCRILEKKLDEKNIKFEICEDIETMQNKGISSVPVIEVNNEKMSYYDAVKYVNGK